MLFVASYRAMLLSRVVQCEMQELCVHVNHKTQLDCIKQGMTIKQVISHFLVRPEGVTIRTTREF